MEPKEEAQEDSNVPKQEHERVLLAITGDKDWLDVDCFVDVTPWRRGRVRTVLEEN